MVKLPQPRILLISALASGQGKTTVTAALARKFVNQGLCVRVFKTGPDFLDPKVLTCASGAAVNTLDLWMVGLDQCRSQLAQAAKVADVILIEGVMGLYDGTPSSADLARAFDVPVVAVIDASAMAQTCGAVALGLRDYGPVQLAGVVANKIASPGHANMVAESLGDIPLLATMPLQEKSLPERHLGLVMPQEMDQFDGLLDSLAEQLTLNDAAWNELGRSQIASVTESDTVPPLLAGKQIAIACDAAFAFIYPANLNSLLSLGATLRFFSPLTDEPVPDSADAVYLPGGYPELHAATLSVALIWRASIRLAHEKGVPIWAECGGMMALADTLTDHSGTTWTMAGILPGTVKMQKRLAGLGAQGLTMLPGILRGHSFHYSILDTSVKPKAHTFKHAQHGCELAGEAVYRVGSLTASYFHAYFQSNPAAAAALLNGEY